MIDFLKNKWNIVLYFVAIFSVVLTVAFRNDTMYQDKYVILKDTDFSQGWTYEFEDGTSGTTSLPATLPKNDSQVLTLTNTLPEVKHEDSLFYRSRHTSIQIYIDGVLRLDTLSMMSEDDFWYMYSGVTYEEVPLDEEDAGKEIKIVTKTVLKRYINSPGRVFIGDRGSLFLSVLRAHLSTLIWFMLMLLLAFILFVLWGVYWVFMGQNFKELLCLSLFSVSVAVWTLTESDCGQFFMNDSGILGLLAYEMVMLMPVPIALYFYYYSDREKMRQASKLAAIIPVIVFFINNGLHYTKIIALSETLKVSQLMLVFELIFIAIVQISEIRYKYIVKDGYNDFVWKIPLAGILILVPLAGAEIMKYAFAATRYNNDGVLISLGVTFYMCSLACDSIVRTNFRTQQLKKKSEEKSLFLANMSHEIRTPLNAIIGFNEVILRSATDEKVRNYSVNIQEASENLKAIINSILDISKIESGKLEVYSIEYDSVQLLARGAILLETLAQKKGLECVIDIDSQIPERLIGDENHIVQVVTNLMSNAVKYTEKGTVGFIVKLLEYDEDSRVCKIRVAVTDTGIGIKEEDMGRLFEKFERLDREKNYNVEGTGLGMNIVVQLLKAMNSEIQVNSVYGQGSEFYFDIEQNVIDNTPIGDFEENRAKHHLMNTNVINFTAPDAKILIVDDVQLNLDAACALLEDLKMTIDTASNGKEAVEKVKQNHYDMIFMDHMMPEMDGVQATEAIRNYAVESQDPYYAVVPIIALTANAVVGMKEHFYSVGMQDFVSKPIEINKLIAVIQSWMPKEKIIMQNSTEAVQSTEASVTSELWDSLPEIFNREMAVQYCTKYGLFEKNIRNYKDNYEDTCTRFLSFRDAADVENYCIAVHGLKSTSKMIGLEKIFDEALWQENACKEERADEVWPRVEKLLDMYKEAAEVIKAFLGEEERPDGPVISDEEYENLKKEILAAAESFDMEAMMNYEESLSKLSVAEDKKEEFDQIKKYIQNASFGDLTDLLS